ncbi:MAG: hypothetical protein H7330_14150 [Hymenobacteraceae bacterium]|nr:hypothetical protein [Hymenobacteraceae bacterium]
MLSHRLRPVFASATLVAALLLAGTASAQSRHQAFNHPRPVPPTPTARPVKLVAEAAPGTYQLVRLANKQTISITTDALAEIERRRHATDEVSWIISPYARVRILPRRVIEAADFQPIEAIVDTK